ncbi:MAG: NAD(P)-dependent oxidoreductase [Candidatus Nanopelagicales bacterium]
MSRITVIGGTGFAGRYIVAEAAARGHQVTVVSRQSRALPVEGVTYIAGDVLDPGVLEQTVSGADVAVEALSPRGELEGRLGEVVRTLADLAAAAGVRLGVVGGAGSLLVAEGGPTVAESADFPEEFRPEAAELAGVLADLRETDNALDWFFLSPAAGFGSWNPGVHTGVFRLGGDVLLTDAEGNSNISGADLAQAVVDEIERPAHHRERFTIAY